MRTIVGWASLPVLRHRQQLALAPSTTPIDKLLTLPNERG